jgi:hypothetical protein
VTTHRHGRRSAPALARALAPFVLAACTLSACARTGAPAAEAPIPAAEPAASPECPDICVIEIENRTPLQLDVIVRDGLSIRTLGVVPGYATVTVEVPVGVPARQVDARVPPGAIASGGAGRNLDCQFKHRGGGTARIVCEGRRG